MIRQLTIEDLDELVSLVKLLWPNHRTEKLNAEFSDLLKSQEAAIFGKGQKGELCGFAQCQLRTDYVEGTCTCPVGYLEGIFVKENHRQQGIAKALCRACETWIKIKGGIEFASDCEIDNHDSYEMHVKLGFIEVNRLICFTKKIN